MSTNKEKFLSLVTGEDKTLLKDIEKRNRNKAMLRESKRIATMILVKLDKLGWTQKTLSEKMGVSPQQINKIVRGQENLTLDTLLRLQEVLDVQILATTIPSPIASTHTIYTTNQMQAKKPTSSNNIYNTEASKKLPSTIVLPIIIGHHHHKSAS